MRVMVTGHTTVVAMNAFKLEAGLLHVEIKTNLSDHLQGDIGRFWCSSWCTLAWWEWFVEVTDRERDVQSTASVLNETGVGGLSVEVATDNKAALKYLVERGLAVQLQLFTISQYLSTSPTHTTSPIIDIIYIIISSCASFTSPISLFKSLPSSTSFFSG